MGPVSRAALALAALVVVSVLARRTGRRVVLTEVGYRSVAGALGRPSLSRWGKRPTER